jgi:nucleoside-diphosphate-sugar epimerase
MIVSGERIFVAGAGGVVGRRLIPLLLQSGYQVFGTTRSPERAAELERAGVTPVIVDAYDRQALVRAVGGISPGVVIHQLTDLSGGFAPEQVNDTLARNARLRVEGTRNLVAAAHAASARRLIAQSLVWVYTPGPEPHSESDPIDPTKHGVWALENAVLEANPGVKHFEGVVLRYGWFYGPGANQKPAGSPGLHVDAAAQAAVLAIERGAPGAYNIAEPSPHATIEKARRELGFDPSFRLIA